MVEHYERIQNLGYSHHNRGVGLGFGGMHAAAPPASLLRQCAQVGDRLNLTLALTVTVTLTLTPTPTLPLTRSDVEIEGCLSLRSECCRGHIRRAKQI